MKTRILSLIASSILAIASISCSPDDETTPAVVAPPVNTGDLVLFAIDTAKVNTMAMLGTNETTVLNRKLNDNSYISDFDLSPDGTKFIYVETQLSGVFPNLVRTVKLKIANADGSNDSELFSAQNALQGSEITSIRYCNDGKIFFSYEEVTSSGSASALTNQLINPDGTGGEILTVTFGNLNDVSSSRRYGISNGVYPNVINRTTIYDNTLDNGAGALLSEDFDANDLLAPSSITKDDKYALIPFKNGNDIKVKIIDLATKEVVTKTIVTNLSSGWVSFRLNMASDSVRGVLTITGQDYPKSKSYIFNATTGVVSTPFENNDTNVLDVYAF